MRRLLYFSDCVKWHLINTITSLKTIFFLTHPNVYVLFYYARELPINKALSVEIINLRINGDRYWWPTRFANVWIKALWWPVLFHVVATLMRLCTASARNIVEIRTLNKRMILLLNVVYIFFFVWKLSTNLLL